MTDTDTARVRFSGLFSEAFPIPEIGDQATFTVKATCTAHTEQNMGHEGIRRTVTLKVERVVEGVSESVHDGEDWQMSLADVEIDDEDPDIAPDDDPDPDDDDSNTYPAFSGAQA